MVTNQYKKLSDLGPLQLWELRKSIIITSPYFIHYANKYSFDEKYVFEFFKSWLKWIKTTLFPEELRKCDDYIFIDLFYRKYNTYTNFCKYIATLNKDF